MSVRLARGGFFGRTLAGAVTPRLDVKLQRHAHRAGETTPPHAHERPYLALVARGAFREFVGAREHACTPGSLALDLSGEEHHDRFEALGTEILNVELAPSWLEALRAEQPVPTGLTWTHQRGLQGRARLMRHHLEHPEALSPFVLEGAAAELLLLARPSRARAERGGTPPPWLRLVEEVLREPFRAPPSLGELARLVERSPSQVVRVFRRWHGVSLGAFARRLRAERARRTLLETSRPLSEVAREAGYSNQSHMTREILVHLGCTPARLRREAGRRDGA